jgi:hypothetical protein
MVLRANPARYGSAITVAAPGTSALIATNAFPLRSTVVAIGMGRPLAASVQIHGIVVVSHRFTVPPTAPMPNSTAANDASSSSVTYKVPSGARLRSTIEVKPSATTVQAGLVAQSA